MLGPKNPFCVPCAAKFDTKVGKSLKQHAAELANQYSQSGQKRLEKIERYGYQKVNGQEVFVLSKDCVLDAVNASKMDDCRFSEDFDQITNPPQVVREGEDGGIANRVGRWRKDYDGVHVAELVVVVSFAESQERTGDAGPSAARRKRYGQDIFDERIGQYVWDREDRGVGNGF